MYNLDAPEYARAPRRLLESLNRFGQDGVPTGGFLRAVLTNNLIEAAAHADIESAPHLVSIALYVHHELPFGCFGSVAKVDAWIVAGRERRLGFRACEDVTANG